MRIASATFTAVFLVALWLTGAAAQDQWSSELKGRFFGAGPAAGAEIDISPDSEGFTGTFDDGSGNAIPFEAERRGDVAETVLDLNGRVVVMRMTPLPFGAEVVLIPMNPDGRVEIGETALLTFLREGIDAPSFPPDYADPPSTPNQAVTANTFLASYEFWPPKGVRDGYLGLPQRFRTLMTLFAPVQLDVIWKLCLAPGAEQALAMALKDQGVNCAQVIRGIADAQRTGRFNAYKQEVAAARKTLHTAVRCADNYVMPQGACVKASREVATAAVALQTAATVLARYR